MITTTADYFSEHVSRYIEIASKGEEVEIILFNGKSLKLEVSE